MDDSHAYDDIINLPHHVSGRHPQMSAAQRAMQFASYKALAGYEDMIGETARLTDSRPDLDESRKEELDRTLRQLAAQAAQRTDGARKDQAADPLRRQDDDSAPRIRVTWFVPDEYKSGGLLRTVRGRLKKVDYFRRMLILIPEEDPGPESRDGSPDSGPLQIPAGDICEIEIL